MMCFSRLNHNGITVAFSRNYVVAFNFTMKHIFLENLIAYTLVKRYFQESYPTVIKHAAAKSIHKLINLLNAFKVDSKDVISFQLYFEISNQKYWSAFDDL